MEVLNGICDILADNLINLSDLERERFCFSLAIIVTYCILLAVWKDGGMYEKENSKIRQDEN